MNMVGRRSEQMMRMRRVERGEETTSAMRLTANVAGLAGGTLTLLVGGYFVVLAIKAGAYAAGDMFAAAISVAGVTGLLGVIRWRYGYAVRLLAVASGLACGFATGLIFQAVVLLGTALVALCALLNWALLPSTKQTPPRRTD